MNPLPTILQGPLAINPLVRAAEDSKRPSCILCLHFRLIHHGTRIVCDKRKHVYYHIEVIPKKMVENCAVRAKTCPAYEEDV